MAPGLEREFSSSNWPQIPFDMWEEARESARSKIRTDVELKINATDVDPEALKLGRKNAEAAGVLKHIHFQEKSFQDLTSKREFGCVITNPPYGERLSDHKQLMPLYQGIPGILQRLPTWSFFIITSMPRFEAIIQKSATRRRKLFNGRIECMYYQYLGPKPPKLTHGRQKVSQDGKPVVTVESDFFGVVESKNVSDRDEITNASVDVAPDESPYKKVEVLSQKKPTNVSPIFGSIAEKDREQAELFASRLRKRAKHLRRWPTKRGISCFRIYERDIPELPFVVDRYGDALHITEYDRPHERDLGRHSGWLELMCKTAAETLDVARQNVFFKSRQRIRGKNQYQKVAQDGELRRVTEDGLEFFINLQDYVDTGLFLDHRETRKMVRAESDGRKFLNLFAYTGSFSVYAAAGGASSTTTVDWSNTYIDWAKRNMALNGFTDESHRFESMDALDFLKLARLRGESWDLVVVDPPTFSNSKRSDNDWDVQTCHVELLKTLAGCVTHRGIVYFSTNFRRFKLAEEELSEFEFREISKQTIPEDFRNKRIHRCWRLVRRAD